MCATISSLLSWSLFASFIFHCIKGGNAVGKLIPSSLDGLYMTRNIGSPLFLWLLGIYWYILLLDEASPPSFLGRSYSRGNLIFGFETLSIAWASKKSIIWGSRIYSMKLYISYELFQLHDQRDCTHGFLGCLIKAMNNDIGATYIFSRIAYSFESV